MSSMKLIRISGIEPESIVDGEGIRYVIFAQGCPHHCPGCHNPQTHPFGGGKLVLIEDILNDISKRKDWIDGITISGGEPFCQIGQCSLIAQKAHGMGLSVWCYTGYLFEDNLMVLGNLSYQHSGYESVPDYISVGVGGRYYIVQNGIYLGVNCKLIHANHNYNDVMPGVEVGYAYFLSRTVTVEPAVYYDQSFKKHSDFSTIGFKIGIGVYL